MVDFTRMWREFKADIMREVDTKLRQAGIVGQTIDGRHMPVKSLPAHAHAHVDTTGQTPNDHHNQVHDLFGADHADVDTTTLPTDGQVLVWDAVAEKWKPAPPSSGAALTVEEIDGAPSVSDVDTIIVTNGTLTDNGDGSVSLDFGSAATDGSAIHDNEAGEIHAITEKTTPVDDDELLIEDSADGYKKKRVKICNLPAGAKLLTETQYGTPAESLSMSLTETDIVK